MTPQEIKEKMTPGPWRHQNVLNESESKIDGYPQDEDHEYWETGIVSACGERHDVNATAIITAVNNTYGKNLNPVAMEECVEALIEAVSTIETIMREHEDNSPSCLMSLRQVKKALEKAKLK